MLFVEKPAAYLCLLRKFAIGNAKELNWTGTYFFSSLGGRGIGGFLVCLITKSSMIELLYPLDTAICLMMLISSSRSSGLSGKLIALCTIQLSAAILWLRGWNELLWMVALVAVGFLYTLKVRDPSFFSTVTSRKLILFSISCSIVNWIFG